MAPAPRHFVFDAYGTLFDVHSAAARYTDDIGPTWERLSQTWRAKHLEYTWIYAQIGQRKSFWELTERSLDFAIASVGGLGDDSLRNKLLDAYMTLGAYPEVREVLGGLKGAGCTTAILSNGDPDMLEAAIGSAGLGDVLDASLSVVDAGVFKPNFKVYDLVVDRFGCERASVSFQSSNRWDAAAAKAYGFGVCWINRAGQPAEYPDLAPDHTLDNLRPLLELV
ncbi:MAG: haloacid dehalogenase type II [Pseudomonadota bacterium]